MTTETDAVAFSHAWGDAWNRRDVEAVLAHFYGDAIFSSPVAQRITTDRVCRRRDREREGRAPSLLGRGRGKESQLAISRHHPTGGIAHLAACRRADVTVPPKASNRKP
jgi:hypothetical protein